MAYGGYGNVLDTPRSNIGDATYLHQPDLDISQEASFVSPTKEDAQQNLFNQLRGGRSGATIRTPRRGPLADRHNMQDPGPEFTPLLKSTTKNNGFRRRGKENGKDMPGTPTGLLGRIEEDLTPLPFFENSLLGRSMMSVGTPLPAVEASSVESTPLKLPPKRNFSGKGPLDSENQMSLREQENVIDKIEKENFGLKLKIHFLEEALRKAGPGYSEAALKENTELKVDKVQMQHDLKRYKKHLSVAEKDLETYRQQMIELQERSKKKYADENLKAEVDRLRVGLEEKEIEINRLRTRLENAENGSAEADKLRDEITDLESELREKERQIAAHQDEMDELQEKLNADIRDKARALDEKEEEIEELQQAVRDSERALAAKDDELADLQQSARDNERALDEKDEEVAELQSKVQRLAERESEIDVLKEKLGRSREKDNDLNEMQEKLRRLEDRDGERNAEIDALKAKLRKASETDADLSETQEKLRRLEHREADREAELASLREKLRWAKEREVEAEQLHDRMRSLQERDSEAADLERRLMEAEARSKNEQRMIAEYEARLKIEQRRMVELEERAQIGDKANDELEFARDTIEDLERKIRHIEATSNDLKDKMQEVQMERERAEADLEELQEEMANKSTMTKGFSRQIEEKTQRLQMELDQAGHDYSNLERQYSQALAECEDLRTKARETKRERDTFERDFLLLKSKFTDIEVEVEALRDQKAHLQNQHENVAAESSMLQKESVKLRKLVSDLENSLAREKERMLDLDKDAHDLYKADIDRLNEQVFNLQATIRERENLYDTDSEKWESNKRALESARDRAEERAAGLQRTIDRLRQAGDSLSSKENQLQDSLKDEIDRHKREETSLNRRIEELQRSLDSKQSALSEIRTEMLNVRDELRRTQTVLKSETDKSLALADEVEVLQAALEEDAEVAAREKEDLRTQIESLRAASRASASSSSDEVARQTSVTLERLRTQLSESSTNFGRVSKEKLALQEQVATITLELQTIRGTIAEVRAERDEYESELRTFTNQRGEETYRIDQERVDLRAARTKLDLEVRRLMDENRLLEERRISAERALEDEIDRASAEEEKLTQEINKLRLSCSGSNTSESLELASARRTIRDLERRVQDLQVQLAAAEAATANIGDGNSEVSIMRRDLVAARQKELDYISRESSNKETVRGLKKQIAELEHQLHEAEMNKLIASPKSVTSSPSAATRRAEVEVLRKQVTTAHQSLQETKAQLREAERKAVEATAGVRAQLADVEDERTALEEALDEARRVADDVRTQHERESRKLMQRLERAEREAQSAMAQAEEVAERGMRGNSQESKDLKRQLRKALLESEALEHDVRMQFETIESLTASEAALRKKLERTRGERSAFRVGAEKMARTVQSLKDTAAMHEELAANLQQELEKVSANDARGAVEELGRALKGAEEKHKKELRGLVMQMEWMQARWEREAALRADAAFAKRFLQLQLDVATACNTAQLRELEHIRRDILGNQRPLVLPSHALQPSSPTTGRPSLRAVVMAVRFTVRARKGAAKWHRQEVTRVRIVEAVEDMRKQKRISEMRDAAGERRQRRERERERVGVPERRREW